MLPAMIVEICLDSLDSVAAAAEGGADRIELCAGLVEGGLTPSVGTLTEARRLFSGTIVHMIRPRGGDFHYSAEEVAAMERDIRMAAEHGADEFIFGALDIDGTIDEVTCRTLIEACGGRPAVFHRAFDVSADLPAGLETLIGLGFRRVLTSGGRSNATAGATAIADLVRRAGGRIAILPGGGVTAENALDIVRITGADQIHLTAASFRDSAMTHRRDIPMGAPAPPGEYRRAVADSEVIGRIRRNLAG